MDSEDDFIVNMTDWSAVLDEGKKNIDVLQDISNVNSIQKQSVDDLTDLLQKQTLDSLPSIPKEKLDLIEFANELTKTERTFSYYFFTFFKTSASYNTINSMIEDEVFPYKLLTKKTFPPLQASYTLKEFQNIFLKLNDSEFMYSLKNSFEVKSKMINSQLNKKKFMSKLKDDSVSFNVYGNFETFLTKDFRLLLIYDKTDTRITANILSKELFSGAIYIIIINNQPVLAYVKNCRISQYLDFHKKNKAKDKNHVYAEFQICDKDTNIDIDDFLESQELKDKEKENYTDISSNLSIRLAYVCSTMQHIKSLSVLTHINKVSFIKQFLKPSTIQSFKLNDDTEWYHPQYQYLEKIYGLNKSQIGSVSASLKMFFGTKCFDDLQLYKLLCQHGHSPNQSNMDKFLDLLNDLIRIYDDSEEEISFDIVNNFKDTTKNGVVQIRGPPGTGKSFTTAVLILEYFKLLSIKNKFIFDTNKKDHKKLIVTAKTNVAIDCILSKLHNMNGFYNSNLVLFRFGNLSKTGEHLHGFHILNFVKKWKFHLKLAQTKINILINKFQDKLGSLKTLHIKSNNYTRFELILMKYKKILDSLNKLKDQLSKLEFMSIHEICKDFMDCAIVTLNSSASSLFLECVTLDSEEYENESTTNKNSVGDYRDYDMDVEFAGMIVDESAQVSDLDFLFPFRYNIQKFIMIGDEKQLEPMLLTPVYERSKNFLTPFNRFLKFHKPYYLDTQYRMHEEISRFPKQAYYENKLEDGPLAATEQKCLMHEGKPLLKHNSYFIECSGTEIFTMGSYANYSEVQSILMLLETIASRYSNNIEEFPTIGILSFYKSQNTVLCELFENTNSILKHIVISPFLKLAYEQGKLSCLTVDGAQGQEMDIVIITMTRSKSLGFLTNKNRINVALTRAKKLRVVIGNIAAILSQRSDWTLFLKSHVLNENLSLIHI